MRIVVLLDPTRLRRWHLWLLDVLEARGLDAPTVRFIAAPRPPLPSGLELVMRLERLSGRAGRDTALDPLAADDPAFARRSQTGTMAGETAAADALVIDARGLPASGRAADLRPLYDGDPCEHALWRALLAGRAPTIGVRSPAGATIDMALPAIESPQNLHAAASMTFSRVADALALTAADIAAGRAPRSRLAAPPPPRVANSGTAAGFLSALATTRLRRLRDRLSRRTPRWAVAYRHAPAGRTHPPASLDIAAFTLLEDDGRRYYADPFLFEHQGRLHLFVEEVPDATRRGIVSHCALGPDGRFPTPRPIIERPYHLSYPQVFAHGGEIWMLPETSAAGAVELYRADSFPGRFVLHARLIEGAFHDATLFEHGGRLWISAGSQSRGSSTWDGLSLFHAVRLEGPWTPHPANPVLLDARSARPAGQLYRHDGTLIRPSQDCTRGYGAALTLSRLDVGEATFRETAVATLTVPGDAGRLGRPGSPGILGPHTVNFAGGIEVIDLYAPPSWRPAGRGTR
jgi:hypothetical protein